MINEYSPKEFLDKYLPVLEENEALHQLIIGNIYNDLEEPTEGNFFMCIEEDEPYWFICNHLPFSLLVFPADPRDPHEEEESAKQLASKLREEGREITGIQSSPLFARTFIKEWNASSRVDLLMDVMVCKEAADYPAKGILRKAEMQDIETLADMSVKFNQDALHDHDDREEVKEKILKHFDSPVKDFFLYEIDGRPVGMCASTRQLPHGRSISYVFIEREERGKGYAKEMMSLVTKKYLEDNDYVTLYVDVTNPVSNKVYTDIGYDYCGRVENYRFE